jgi:hypothetical protein
MSSPEARGGEVENLWTRWSRIREARRAELLAENPNLTVRQMSAMLWDIVPLRLGPTGEAEMHKGTDDGIDNRWDVPDAYGEMPGADSIEEIKERLARLLTESHDAGSEATLLDNETQSE